MWNMENLPGVKIKDLKIGIARTANWDKCAPETVAAIERAATLLADQGATIFDLDLPEACEQMSGAQKTILRQKGIVNSCPRINLEKLITCCIRFPQAPWSRMPRM